MPSVLQHLLMAAHFAGTEMAVNAACATAGITSTLVNIQRNSHMLFKKCKVNPL